MIRDIKISPVLNGFIVVCGCQTVVFDDIDNLTKSLNTYLKDPDFIEKEWMHKSINSKHTTPSIEIATDCASERPQAEAIRSFSESGGACVESILPTRR